MSLLGKYLADRDSEDLKKVFLVVLIIATIILTIFLLFYYGRATSKAKQETKRLQAEINEIKDETKDDTKRNSINFKIKSKNKDKDEKITRDKDEMITSDNSYEKEFGADGETENSENNTGTTGDENSSLKKKGLFRKDSGAVNSEKDLKDPRTIQGNPKGNSIKNLKGSVPDNANELILSDIKTLRSTGEANVEKYTNYEINNFSLKSKIENNISTRDKYIDYINENNLSQDLVSVLENDNEKDRELLKKLSGFDREALRDFSY